MEESSLARVGRPRAGPPSLGTADIWGQIAPSWGAAQCTLGCSAAPQALHTRCQLHALQCDNQKCFQTPPRPPLRTTDWSGRPGCIGLGAPCWLAVVTIRSRLAPHWLTGTPTSLQGSRQVRCTVWSGATPPSPGCSRSG